MIKPIAIKSWLFSFVVFVSILFIIVFLTFLPRKFLVLQLEITHDDFR